jgi:hypothetical protein
MLPDGTPRLHRSVSKGKIQAEKLRDYAPLAILSAMLTRPYRIREDTPRQQTSCTNRNTVVPCKDTAAKVAPACRAELENMLSDSLGQWITCVAPHPSIIVTYGAVMASQQARPLMLVVDRKKYQSTWCQGFCDMREDWHRMISQRLLILCQHFSTRRGYLIRPWFWLGWRLDIALAASVTKFDFKKNYARSASI